MRVDGSFELPMACEEVFSRLLDTAVIAECLPGCEAIEQLSPQRYRSTFRVTMAGITARFNAVVEITEQESPTRIVCTTRGEEGGRASNLAADSVILLDALEATLTRVCYSSEVSLTGRLGRFALGVMAKKAQSLAEEFAARLRTRLEQETQHGDLERPVPAPNAA